MLSNMLWLTFGILRLPPPSTALCVPHTSLPPPPVAAKHNTTAQPSLPLHQTNRFEQEGRTQKGIQGFQSIKPTAVYIEEFVVGSDASVPASFPPWSFTELPHRSRGSRRTSTRFVLPGDLLPRKSTPGEVRSTYMHPLYQLPQLSV